MARFALKIEYNGAPFCGWQRQKVQLSVQRVLEQALAQLGETEAAIYGAGRTDAGVHATGQVAHCDLRKDWQAFRLSEALNYHLRPHPVSVLQAMPVPDHFHARFSAISRHYIYHLTSRRAPIALERGLSWRVNHDLDVTAMQVGADYLIGNHDFTTFRSTMCQAKSPIKSLDQLEITKTEIPHGSAFRFHFKARSFLHNQVRSFVGTLVRVGSGYWSPERVKKALEACDRTACGPVAPPQGLYLAGVIYAQDPFQQERP